MEEDEAGSEADYRTQTNKQVLALRQDAALPSHPLANTVHFDLAARSTVFRVYVTVSTFHTLPVVAEYSHPMPTPHPAYTFRSITINLGTIYEDTMGKEIPI